MPLDAAAAAAATLAAAAAAVDENEDEDEDAANCSQAEAAVDATAKALPPTFMTGYETIFFSDFASFSLLSLFLLYLCFHINIRILVRFNDSPVSLSFRFFASCDIVAHMSKVGGASLDLELCQVVAFAEIDFKNVLKTIKI